MTFDVRLKTGFFKTQPYFLTISQGQIILTPQDADDDGRLVIDADNVQSIYLTSGEFEIITDVIYTGILPAHTNIKQLSHLLATEFGEKLIVQYIYCH
jgi:hypothetical protein